ncbi:hypothetical protein AB0D34_08320 [Streptomyces sp. NPDC048420]|uniref:hypothetical protein n=1 Tax=Streptomyces sp. NPDC048420 TaxID=3155755 RepID=UPI0034328776
MILIVFAAALATMGLAFLLPDLIGRKPKAKNHGSTTEQRVWPAVGNYVLLAETSGYLECAFGAVPRRIGVIVRHSWNRIDDTRVFVHWLTKSDDLVGQVLAALDTRLRRALRARRARLPRTCRRSEPSTSH